MLLLKGGIVQPCVIPKSRVAAARGAVGLDESRRYLIVLVIDGIEGTTGLKTADFGVLMKAFGGWNAVNLDGGGSSEFLYYPGYGAPRWCGACADFILEAQIPANPNGLKFATRPYLPDASKNINFVADRGGERFVYASIGFRLTNANR